jgi:hypothetical protein
LESFEARDFLDRSHSSTSARGSQTGLVVVEG